MSNEEKMNTLINNADTNNDILDTGWDDGAFDDFVEGEPTAPEMEPEVSVGIDVEESKGEIAEKVVEETADTGVSKELVDSGDLDSGDADFFEDYSESTENMGITEDIAEKVDEQPQEVNTVPVKLSRAEKKAAEKAEKKRIKDEREEQKRIKNELRKNKNKRVHKSEDEGDSDEAAPSEVNEGKEKTTKFKRPRLLRSGDPDNLVLFLVIDTDKADMLSYFRDNQLKVSRIFHTIREVRDEMLMQTDFYRVVIVDTGMGKFTSPSVRQEVMDMLGMRDDESRISIFYTDSVLKSDATRLNLLGGENLEWFHYTSTLDVVVKLLSKYEEENYVYDMMQKLPVIKSPEEILSMQGREFKSKNKISEVTVTSQIDSGILRKSVDDDSKQIEFYIQKEA